MLLHINDMETLSDLQEKFNMCFPSLKIEFCRKRHHWEGICPENQLWPAETPVSKVRRVHNPGTIELKSWDKVGEVEKRFYDEFGLNVQIFYRNGDRWIQTGKSDNLTINELEDRAYYRAPQLLL